MQNSNITKLIAIAGMVENGLTSAEMEIQGRKMPKLIEIGINDYIISILKTMYKDPKYDFGAKSSLLLIINSSNEEKFDLLLATILGYLDTLQKVKYPNKSFKEIFEDQEAINIIEKELFDENIMSIISTFIGTMANKYIQNNNINERKRSLTKEEEKQIIEDLKSTPIKPVYK
jgi:hypothetical protein